MFRTLISCTKCKISSCECLICEMQAYHVLHETDINLGKVSIKTCLSLIYTNLDI
jgi:hypothetical protein